MSSSNQTSICYFPDEMVENVASFCDIETKRALNATSRQLNRKFIGSVKLTKKASKRFIREKLFRHRIESRLASPIGKIHIHIEALKLTKRLLAELIRVKSTTKLELWFGKMLRVKALACLTNTTVLDVSCKKITDVSWLAKLTSLRDLYISETRVTDISALSHLKSLRVLDINSTKVADISVLAKLKSLRKLYLWWTKVSDFSVLTYLR